MTVPACPLCAIVSGNAAATVLRCWPDVLAVAAPRPHAPGHLLLIPTEHVRDVADAPGVAAVVMAAAAEIAADHPVCDITTTHERTRPADELRHLHLNLIPRTPAAESPRTGATGAARYIR